ncbi:YtpR family tRNA-binding protein [Viridibacillus arvi]|jgi:tRNA-binding protein|uniref:YtpR family tRNA-binding protein n=1 Tax=Viridibacillus arvi TaxID=263475 RepID=UPI0036A14C28
MIVSYNKAYVGDVLLVQLSTEAIVKTVLEKHGDLVLLKEESTGEVKGFNLFNASKYMQIEQQGNVEITEELVAAIDAAIAKNGATLNLDVDLTPKFVVGLVEEKEKHPNADKLNICKVNVGDEILQIVCGAPNVEAGQKVVVAKVGAVMPSGMLIKDAELRGVPSSGMICSARELAIPNAPQVKGILVLEDDAVEGTPFQA